MKAFSRAHDKWIKAANQKLIDLAIATADLIKDHQDMRRRITALEKRQELFNFDTPEKMDFRETYKPDNNIKKESEE
tara:strand:- start:11592 stop:11822 length:231 start_codon:yes stop_codon:yes gene_type:complete